MIKMFSTQLAGLFKNIYEQNEFELEDGARLLAQAAVSDGTIFVKGFGEMEAVCAEAFSGAEPFDSGYAKKMSNIEEIRSADRVVLFSRFSNDSKAVTLGQELAQKGIPFVAVCTVVDVDSGMEFGGEQQREQQRELEADEPSGEPELVDLMEAAGEQLQFGVLAEVAEFEDGKAFQSGDLLALADVVIDLRLKKGLLPEPSGNRVGYPGAMAGLFAFHALKFTLEEILEDFE